MAGQRRALVAPVDDEIVALGLARDCFFDRGFEQAVSLRSPQRGAQVSGVFLAEAHIERARAVTRTRLHDSQKLWVSGVMKPSRPPVSATLT